jgi:hypothetical protein
LKLQLSPNLQHSHQHGTITYLDPARLRLTAMSWFWWQKNDKNDPTKSLSPDLKDFLKDQQPRPYVPADAPEPSSEPVEKPQKPPPVLPDTNRKIQDRPLPRESLFPDGRYKDIWKTYTPQDEIAATTTSPLDRIISARKDRRAMIHRAALENCAFEEEIQRNCFVSGDIKNRARARMTMCRQETKAFNRCFQLQAKFLQALGYLTSANSSDEDEERIQMHADKLYHRMMDYENAVEEAKLNDDPIPPLSSLFDPARPAPSLEQLDLPTGMERRMKKPLHELPPHERELAVRAALQEAKMAHLYKEDFQNYAVEMNEQRKERQQWLIKQFGEPIGKFIIPDPPKEPAIKPYSMEDLERRVWTEGGSGAAGETRTDQKSSEGT